MMAGDAASDNDRLTSSPSEIERAGNFSGHSLRAGLASSAEVDERYVQNSSATPLPR